MSYEHESYWRARWVQDRLHTADVGPGTFYNLVEFPYPSAEGLHVGNVRTYAGADVVGRYNRMRGRDVFQPMGFDSFGINAENYALRTGVHPRRLIERTIARFREQLSSFGAGWDWSREVITSDPSYYRWTQWIFTRLHRAGLAYRADAPVVWCPSCKTVLAREQLEGEACERCGTHVVERVMTQWFLRITRYADALLDGLDALDWPDWAKRQQAEWIGRSEGVEIDFPISPPARDFVASPVTVFTTRPDTIHGVTFVAVSRTHPLAAGTVLPTVVTDRFVTTNGARTEHTVRHPVSGAPLPVYVADYVLGGYGTGAVMGVPAHDERDEAFAAAHGISVSHAPLDPSASSRFRPAVRYRLHDWLISRQRYWGSPIPIVHCAGCGEVPVPDDELPVLLPDVEDFHPTGTGRSPLASVADFVDTCCPSCGSPARRETDVADTFVESAWYFLRYPCTDVHDAPWLAGRVLPVSQYEGGREHITRHHLYARFMCHALYDLGLITFREPFPRIRYHGLVSSGGSKMSKTKGNVVNPDAYIAEVGADNLRLALLFCGPWETGGEFTDEGVQGVVRFTSRLRRLVHESTADGGVDDRALHRAIDKIGRDIEGYRFNTAIASLMEVVNSFAAGGLTADAARVIVRLLAPFAPHLAEDLWQHLGGDYSVHTKDWPVADADKLREAVVDIPVEVDGKVRDVVRLPADADAHTAEAAALASEKVLARLAGASPRRVVYVPGRVLNIITRDAV